MLGRLKALVLAAGEGTRLRPLTLDRPKPMLPINGRPLLEHTLALLRHHGIKDIAINLHYKPNVITDYFAGAKNINLVYSYEDRILGTAGAAKKLASFLETTFLVFYGDVLADLDLSAIIAYHYRKRAQMTIVAYEVDEPTRCGIVEVGRDGRAASFVEKPSLPRTNLASTGIFVVEPSVLRFIPDGFADFGYEVIPKLIEAEEAVFVQPVDRGTYILDIGSIERYEQACRDASEGRIRMLTLSDGSTIWSIGEA